MRRGRFRPFTGDTASRVNLEKNALALVLCQVRSGYVPPKHAVTDAFLELHGGGGS